MCAECGDVGCGAVTTYVVVDGAAVEWRDVRFSTGDPLISYDDDVPGPCFRFDRQQVRTAIADAVRRVHGLELASMERAVLRGDWLPAWGGT